MRGPVAILLHKYARLPKITASDEYLTVINDKLIELEALIYLRQITEPDALIIASQLYQDTDHRAKAAQLWARSDGANTLNDLADKVVNIGLDMDESNSISIESWHKPVTC